MPQTDRFTKRPRPRQETCQGAREALRWVDRRASSDDASKIERLAVLTATVHFAEFIMPEFHEIMSPKSHSTPLTRERSYEENRTLCLLSCGTVAGQ
jgi:hypothetical protein